MRNLRVFFFLISLKEIWGNQLKLIWRLCVQLFIYSVVIRTADSYLQMHYFYGYLSAKCIDLLFIEITGTSIRQRTALQIWPCLWKEEKNGIYIFNIQWTVVGGLLLIYVFVVSLINPFLRLNISEYLSDSRVTVLCSNILSFLSYCSFHPFQVFVLLLKSFLSVFAS